VLLCLLLEQNLDAPGKEAELNKSRADAEVDSDAHQQEHGERKLPDDWDAAEPGKLRREVP